MNANLEIHTVTKSGKSKSAWFNRTFADFRDDCNERKHCESVVANGGLVFLITPDISSAAVTKTIQYLQDLNNKLIGQGK